MVTAAEQLRPPADDAVGRFPETFFDALLVVSFGGPEGPDDVMPFLENATSGRDVPRERLEEAARHYLHFGGVSPINAQNRAFIGALRSELAEHRIGLPIYFGNRNWHPLLADTLRVMAEEGVERALAIVTSGFSCYSSCRQYREDIHTAQALAGPRAPEIAKARVFYNHPLFVEANIELVAEALAPCPSAELLFTAHSIPLAMASRSRYAAQLRESARLIAEGAGARSHQVVYQSRSGSPRVPWLEPDLVARLRELRAEGVNEVVLVPVGFVSDHMEVIYDLDVEAADAARELGLRMVRAPTVGTHPAFVAMVRELVQERLDRSAPRRALGRFGPSHDVCSPTCCRPGTGRPSPWEPPS